jgi:uncharacterized membrane protein
MRRVWLVLLTASYVITVYMFLGQLNGENHMAYVIAPFLILTGALNFVTDDPRRERNALNVQLFVIGSFAATYAAILTGNLRFYRPAIVSNICPFIGLALIVVFIALLKRSQEKAH